MELLLFDEVKGLSDERKHSKFKILRDEVINKILNEEL